VLLVICAGFPARSAPLLPPPSGPIRVTANELPPDLQEMVTTPDGVYLLWYRAQVSERELEMSFVDHSLLVESYQYRLCDHNRRDMLRMGVAQLTTTLPDTEVRAFYTRRLGQSVQVETSPTTGEITLVTGTLKNYRMVIITPRGTHCSIRLERVQQYDIPARIYTERELRVVRVLEEVTRTYRQAGHIAYALEQRASVEGGTDTGTEAPVLMWTIDLVRPDSLQATAMVKDITALRIVSGEHVLQLTRQDGKVETRPCPDGLTTEQLPELDGDTTMQLLLGEPLLSTHVDYMTILPVKDIPTTQQIDVVLTFPETSGTLYLRIDQQRKVIIRSEMVTETETEKLHMVRIYTHLVIEPSTATPANLGAPTTPLVKPHP